MQKVLKFITKLSKCRKKFGEEIKKGEEKRGRQREGEGTEEGGGEKGEERRRRSIVLNSKALKNRKVCIILPIVCKDHTVGKGKKCYLVSE